LPTGRASGLVEAIKVVSGIEGIAFIRFDERDVVRHKLVQQIVKAYEAYSNGRAVLGQSADVAGPLSSAAAEPGEPDHANRHGS